jgi:CHAT domain-containing protein
MRTGACWVAALLLAAPLAQAADAGGRCSAAVEPALPAEAPPLPGGDPDEDLRSGDRAFRSGDLENAARSWRAAAQGFAAAGRAEQEGDARLRLAQAQLGLGRLVHARAEAARARELAGDRADAAREASALAVEGEIALAAGDADGADSLLEQALACAGAERPGLSAAIWNSRGSVRAARGAHAEAAQAYERAAADAARAGDAELAATSEANAVRARIDAGERDGMAQRLDALRARAGELPDSSAKLRVLIHAGRSYAALAESGAGGAAARRAAETLAEAAATAGRIGAKRDASYAQGYLGALYEKSGRAGEALDLTRRAIASAEQADAPEARYRWLWQLGRLQRAAARNGEAIDAYRAAVRTLAALRNEASSAAGAGARELEADVKPVYFGLVDLLLESAAASEDSATRQDLLREARAVVEALKVAELRDYFRDPCLGSEHALQAESVPRTVVVYPVLLPERTELIVSRVSGLERFSVPVPTATLEAEVRRFRALLEKRTTREYLPHADRLYDWLVRPYQAELAPEKTDTLVFVPDGALRTIPMAALRDAGTGKFLVEQVALAITPGLTLTEPRAIARESAVAMRAGLTQAVQGYPGLPYVADELDALGEAFGGTALVDERFVAPSVEHEIASRQLGIVHIASHGEFLPESSQSFVITYDGRIPMDSLGALVSMTRYREQPLELLTLSACQTAAGDSRAALGLAGVAVRAGARSALATLWSVNDRAAADLVSEFYFALREPNTSRAAALQRAQLALLGTLRYRHPGYWAPFVLVSNWL